MASITQVAKSGTYAISPSPSPFAAPPRPAAGSGAFNPQRPCSAPALRSNPDPPFASLAPPASGRLRRVQPAAPVLRPRTPQQPRPSLRQLRPPGQRPAPARSTRSTRAPPPHSAAIPTLPSPASPPRPAAGSGAFNPQRPCSAPALRSNPDPPIASLRPAAGRRGPKAALNPRPGGGFVIIAGRPRCTVLNCAHAPLARQHRPRGDPAPGAPGDLP
ncbi:MAG: hypothetical protein ACI9HE_002678 [Planctomycetota bacterium]|jgi:hypothetical protein